MNCKPCLDEGFECKLSNSGFLTTDMAFFEFSDDFGFIHSHDPNWHSGEFSCPRGHLNAVRWIERCEHCHYGQGKFSMQLITKGENGQ